MGSSINVAAKASGMTAQRILDAARQSDAEQSAVDVINIFRVSPGHLASFHVVSRTHIPYFCSSRRFLGWVRFPAAPQEIGWSER
jgi:hypothetical protein